MTTPAQWDSVTTVHRRRRFRGLRLRVWCTNVEAAAFLIEHGCKPWFWSVSDDGRVFLASGEETSEPLAMEAAESAAKGLKKVR